MKYIPLLSLCFLALTLTNCSDDDSYTETDTTDDTTTDGTTSNSDYTVGLKLNTSEAEDAYTLFSPLRSMNTYLIDNCGDLMYTWASDYLPAHSFYLLENGYLLRPGDVGSTSFVAGGQGGIIELLDAEGTVVWDYDVASTTELQHHDVEYMDNGNILVIAWEKKTATEVATAGRTDYISELWSEKIIEIQPDLTAGTGEVIWEWHAWDHIVQDEDATADNYGVVADNPGLLNINYDYESDEEADWLHFNAIDYNETLDQIVVSSRSYSEFYIIDHSTTTAEAATHEGGTHGQGGDFLYRWGNPQTYDQGSSSDQQLFNQHDANWIDTDYIDGGMIMVFNNQAGSATGSSYSSVNVIDTEVSADGSYTLEDGAYTPSAFQWTYTDETPSNMFSPYISGARRLSNGNTLIGVGSSGTFTEVNYAGETVWEYVNPVSESGIVNQYAVASSNSVFRVSKYATDYVGLENYALSNQGTIESGSDYTCE
ncbi:aryl-sulfate sulfotransferase [Formosa algae]|uniref:aryl-sulfate sulfotransferase n=1 Tax=Formosa algae TaxID=225843 RepID=UPI000CCF5936|nr:aryl-sulfate sulfotransferase [Formosa algae]PNW27062.1 hypothetical protein BKP44_14820 [Formosa algae]